MAGPVYRIHPAIGITRVGNADADKFFIGPELPGLGPTGDPSVGTRVPDFKVGGLLKPQAARFRIWEYVEKNKKLEPSREITLDTKDCIRIVWRVHVANRKASFFQFKYLRGEDAGLAVPPRRNARVVSRRKLEIDPLARQIGGRNIKGGKYEFRKGKSSNPARELWPDPAPSPPIEYLGEIRTDPVGRLIVIGGKGLASGLPGVPLGTSVFNNDGWFDDVSDGRVTAELAMNVGGREKVYAPDTPDEVEGAWVICGPPDFAPSMENLVTLYDLLYDMAARQMTLPANEAIFDTVLKPLVDLNAELLASPVLSKYVPSYDEEIYPILKRAQNMIYTFEPLTVAHITLGIFDFLGKKAAGGSGARKGIFNRLHQPGVAGRPVGVPAADMPLLHGDAYRQVSHQRLMLTLTETQYALMKRWSEDQFKETAGTFPPKLPAWMTTISPHGLDRAALENCVGGAFAPGIEVSWQFRNKKLYKAPFRIDHRASTQYLGDLGGQIQPGHFSRQMSLPWHTDFLSCTIAYGLGWWPAQRPDIAFKTKEDFDDRMTAKKSVGWTRASAANWPSGGPTPKNEEFVQSFYKLGVIREGPAGYHLEKERNDPNVP